MIRLKNFCRFTTQKSQPLLSAVRSIYFAISLDAPVLGATVIADTRAAGVVEAGLVEAVSGRSIL